MNLFSTGNFESYRGHDGPDWTEEQRQEITVATVRFYEKFMNKLDANERTETIKLMSRVQNAPLDSARISAAVSFGSRSILFSTAFISNLIFRSTGKADYIYGRDLRGQPTTDAEETISIGKMNLNSVKH